MNIPISYESDSIQKKILIKVKSKFKFTTLILILSFSPDLEEYMIQLSDWEFGTMPQNDAL